MTSTVQKNIMETWSKIDEVELIKNIATKGQFLELCYEFLANKKNISIDASKEYFHKVVDKLTDTLIEKKALINAEQILKNTKRHFKSVFYEYLFRNFQIPSKQSICNEIKDYLSTKLSHVDFQIEFEFYKFSWTVYTEWKNNFKDNATESTTFELFMNFDEKYRIFLQVEVYFNCRNDVLLEYLLSDIFWEFLIKKYMMKELIIWCQIQIGKSTISNNNKLMKQFSKWEITDKMFNYALENLENPSEVLKDLFIQRSYVFPNEANDVKKILKRIFRTQSVNQNKDLISSLPIGKFLIDNELFIFLLEDFITIEDIEKLNELYSDKSDIFNILLGMKSAKTLDIENFLKLSKLSNGFLSKYNVNIPAIVTLGEFLLNENENTYNVSKLSKLQDSIKSLPLISALMERQKETLDDNNVVRVHNLIKLQLNFDITDISEQINHQSNNAQFKLNYIFHLNQQRSSYAVYNFFKEQLSCHSVISQTNVHGAVENVTNLAIQNYKNQEKFCHYVAFIEMLNFDTKPIRAIVKLLRNLDDELEFLDLSKLIQLTESKLNDSLDNNQNSEKFPLKLYESIMLLSDLNKKNKCPNKYLQKMAEENNWWKLLIFIQYFGIPLNECAEFCQLFSNSNTGKHFFRSLSSKTNSELEKPKRRSSFSKSISRNKSDRVSLNSADAMTSSLSSAFAQETRISKLREFKDFTNLTNLDIFGTIILCTNNLTEVQIADFQSFLKILQCTDDCSTSLKLMRNCYTRNLPILSVLASTVSDINNNWNWLVWLMVTTNNIKIIEEKKTYEIPFKIVENCVIHRKLYKLHQSLVIFFEDNKFKNLTKFFLETNNYNFNDDAISHLKLYLLAWNRNEIDISFLMCCANRQFNDENQQKVQDEIMENITVKLIILQLKYGFTSKSHQLKFLNAISKSGLNDFYIRIDFTTLFYIFEIILYTEIIIDFELFLSMELKEVEIYDGILTKLIDLEEFDKAIKICEILNLSACDIIYAKWINQWDYSNNMIEEFNFQQYESELNKHSLPPEFLVNFYLQAAQKHPTSTIQKYLLYKSALDVIKKNHLFPNESFDRDLIEFEMIVCLLQCDVNLETYSDSSFQIYHSEYFEEILSKERNVLYKSFHELKELAGIDDLTTTINFEMTEMMKIKLSKLLNILLDKGDIVEALRLQAIFECPTVDLRYLVFCMALAEGLTTIYSLSDEERSMFVNTEKHSLATNNLEKRTIEWHALRTNPTVINNEDDPSLEITTLEFEEIPSKQKQEVLDALQGFISNLKYGVELGKRIFKVYRAAMYLDKDYIDVLRTKDVSILLKSATEWDCLKKLMVINDIFTSTQMTHYEISEFLAHEIATSIIRPLFYILNANQENLRENKESVLWGYNLESEFHLILELCPKTKLLGYKLLEYCDVLDAFRKYQDNQSYERSEMFNKLHDIIKKYGLPLPSRNPYKTPQVLSHKKKNTINVELLIKANQCFIHECSVEGTVDVLNRAKVLNSILTKANSWKLIVRMLTGISRYREMYYCFETLIKHDQFENLLGKFNKKDFKSLRHAIVAYLRESPTPQNQEYFRMAALHFLMYKELGEMWEREANIDIQNILDNYQITDKKIIVKKLKCSTELLNNLDKVLESLTQAVENYLQDNKLRMAQKLTIKAELIALQIDLVQKALKGITGQSNQLCICVLNINTNEEYREIINSEMIFEQTLILSRAYSYDINWSEVLLWQFVILDRKDYLNSFIDQMELTDTIIDNIVKGLQIHIKNFSYTEKMENNLEVLIKMIGSVSLRYKLASILSFKNIITTMINEPGHYYLKDTQYGKSDINFL